MKNIFFPIVDKINKNHEILLANILKSINGPNDKVIAYISSHGGNVNSASMITSTIATLPIETIVLNKDITFSAATSIFSSFKHRYAFSDAQFLIHKCIPPQNYSLKESKIFDDFDIQVFDFMVKRMNISLDDLIKLAEKNMPISAQEAFEIGLVQEIIKSSHKDYLEIGQLKTLLKTL